jgi:hypothetical protein
MVGAFGTMGLGARNGTFDHISTLAAQESPVFPGSNVLLLRQYTGVRAIDRQLSVLVTFFAPVVDSRSGTLYLYAIFGLGQFGAAWTLLVMESLRSGNKGRAVSLYVFQSRARCRRLTDVFQHWNHRADSAKHILRRHSTPLPLSTHPYISSRESIPWNSRE